MHQPPPPHPRRAISGETSQACQTARPSAQLRHRIRAGLLLGKNFIQPRDHSAAHGPKATPRQTAQRSPTRPTILVKLRGPSGQPARQLSPTMSAQICFGKLHKDESYCPTDGATACRANRPHCIRAELRRRTSRLVRLPYAAPTAPAHGDFRGNFTACYGPPVTQTPDLSPAQGCSGENFTSPKTTAQQTASRPRPCQTAQRSPPVQPFWSNFAARQTAQRSFIRPGPPRPNFLRTKAPARRSPVQTGTPLTPRPATAQRCPARRCRP